MKSSIHWLIEHSNGEHGLWRLSVKERHGDSRRRVLIHGHTLGFMQRYLKCIADRLTALVNYIYCHFLSRISNKIDFFSKNPFTKLHRCCNERNVYVRQSLRNARKKYFWSITDLNLSIYPKGKPNTLRWSMLFFQRCYICGNIFTKVRGVIENSVLKCQTNRNAIQYMRWWTFKKEKNTTKIQMICFW